MNASSSRIIVYELLILNRNTWNYLSKWKLFVYYCQIKNIRINKSKQWLMWNGKNILVMIVISILQMIKIQIYYKKLLCLKKKNVSIYLPTRLLSRGCVSLILLGRRSSVGDSVPNKKTDVTTRHIKLFGRAFTIIQNQDLNNPCRVDIELDKTSQIMSLFEIPL